MSGVSRAQLFNYLKGGQTPGTTFYQNLKSNKAWINLDWLISGIGTEPIEAELSLPNAVDLKLLEEVIAGVEENLEQIDLTVPPKTKSEVISILYQYFIDTKKNIDPSVVERVLRLAV